MADNYALEMQEHVASFTTSMLRSVADAESRGREQVARAEADTLEARNERDNANKSAHIAQLDALRYKEELDLLKAALKQADVTIAHQKESIAQLRREASQWREQSKNWQDHFTRVEQERCSLSARLESALSLKETRVNREYAPLTPVSRYAEVEDHYAEGSESSPSPTSHRAKDIASIPSPPDVDHPSTSYTTRVPRQAQQKRRTPAIVPSRRSHRAEQSNAEPSTSSTVKVLRRVSTTVRVKREESEDEEGLQSSPPPTPIKRKKSAGSIQKRGAESLFTERNSSQEPEDDAYEDAVDEEEEDDELRINAEHDGDVYKAINTYRKSLTSARSPSKKRKVDTSAVPGKAKLHKIPKRG